MSYGGFKSVMLKVYEEAKFNWKIANFFSHSDDVPCYISSSFCFSKCLWQLCLLRRCSVPHDFIFELHIALLDGNDESSVVVECNSGIKKTDDSVKQLYRDEYTFMNYKKTNIENAIKGLRPSAMIGIIKGKELLQQKTELAPFDVVTISCILKRNFADNPRPLPQIQLPALDELSQSGIMSLTTLSENFRSFFEHKKMCDLTFKVMDKEIHAHKIIMIARSPVFAAMFKHEMSKQHTYINVTDCDPNAFVKFLEYLYSGEARLTFEDAFHLYTLADKFAIPELKTFCFRCMIEDLNIENMYDIAIFASKYDDKELFSAVLHFFRENHEEIVVSSKWQFFLASHFLVANKLLVEL